MTVGDVQRLLKLELCAGSSGLVSDVGGGYCGDLLSDVMANAREGQVWLTIQGHQNIVALAVLKKISAIVLVNGLRPDDETLSRADAEGIPLLCSTETAYALAGLLGKIGAGRESA
ncbi:MAG: serine kinase [Deltaproteobacteria bacterium]|nr:serine kinase [Deltaproteobacteria bacterium]